MCRISASLPLPLSARPGRVQLCKSRRCVRGALGRFTSRTQESLSQSEAAAEQEVFHNIHTRFSSCSTVAKTAPALNDEGFGGGVGVAAALTRSYFSKAELQSRRLS